MFREWSMRLVLPLVALVLAALIYRLVVVSRRGASIEKTVLSLLAMIVLCVTGWWIASWLLLAPDLVPQASPGHRTPSSSL